MNVSQLKELISCAKGEIPADILIKNGNLVNVITRETYKADISIYKDRIVNITSPGTTIKAARIIDATDKFVCPGLIESHLHIESTMLTPKSFTESVLQHGTTTVCIDPHEIGNALGVKGIKLIAEETRHLPLRFLIMIPSCVPAAPGLETSGNVIDSSDIQKLVEDNCLFFGLAEMMNYPGVLFKDDEVMKKLVIGNELGLIDGHSPGLSGRDLDAYISAGISSDHESTTQGELLEKVRKGMTVMARQGSFAKDLENLFRDLDPSLDTRNITISTDDRSVKDLLEKGHLDYSLKLAVKTGIPPVMALQMVTINPATHFGLHKQIGSISPGKIADIVIFDDLENFNVQITIVGGQILYDEGKILADLPEKKYPSWALNSVNLKRKITANDLLVKTEKADGTYPVRVIGVVPNSLLTEHLIEKLVVKDGIIQSDPKNDILSIAVIERYGKNGNVSTGFIKGFDIKNDNFGMITTVGHDSHNIICVATNTKIMEELIHHVTEMKGGLAVYIDSNVKKLPLPFGGLMSPEKIEKVYHKFIEITEFVKKATSFDEPFMAMSFMALPVIPHLKITDKGLVDVDKFSFTSLIVEE